MKVPLVIRAIVRDLAARKVLSDLLVAEGKPPAGTLESLTSLRARYREALAPSRPACAEYVNEPDDGFDLCDRCGEPRRQHVSPVVP